MITDDYFALNAYIRKWWLITLFLLTSENILQSTFSQGAQSFYFFLQQKTKSHHVFGLIFRLNLFSYTWYETKRTRL